MTFSGTGSGTVLSDVGAINCPSTCSDSYELDTMVTLNATADSVSEFTGWSGAGCSGTGTCLVTMDQTQNVTATFQAEQSLSLVFAGTGTGMVTDNNGFTCTANCETFFDYGSTVTLSAAADAGSIFTGWSGAGCSGMGDCVVLMDQSLLRLVETPG